jgi:hypothetical protein
MKGEPAREDKLNFLIRGGLFVYFFAQTKSKRREPVEATIYREIINHFENTLL